jgi:ribonuclease D
MPLRRLVLADTSTELVRSLEALADLPTVGVDVERADWNRYYRAAALIQVGGEGRVALIDPMAVSDLAPLHEFLDARTCVFHAMENDLRPLGAIDVYPRRIEDTSIAAAMLGLPTGLEPLLSLLLGIEPTGDKATMQRADWERRPLTEEMLSYAAGDVADLPALWAVLHDQLVQTRREPWYRQELAAAMALPPVEERREWTRTKGIGRLDPTARSRVRMLWTAREWLARTTDTAPSRILGDRILVDLAASPPDGPDELQHRGMRRQAVRTFGEQIMAALAAGDAQGPEPRPPGRMPTESDREQVDRLRILRAEIARELELDPGVLCPSRTLMAAVLADPTTPEVLRQRLGLRPWQWELLGAPFCEALGIPGLNASPLLPRRKDMTAMTDLLNPDALHHALDQLPGWDGTTEQITKTYKLPDFAGAMRFVNRVADIAEEMNHHPDIHIRWNAVTLEIVSHAAGGVTQSCVELAHRIEEAFGE